jgi:hypothetical protein
MPAPVRVKGSALVARVRWVREKHPDAYQQFLRALSPETARLAGDFMLLDWYPFPMFIELCTVLDRLFGAGDLALCYEIGRYAADVNLKTMYRLLFKLGSVQFILRRAAMAWKMSYDAGELVLRTEDARSAQLEIVDFPTPHRAHCLSVKGWMSRALEMSGARESVIKERCKLLGDPRCEFAAKWR